MHSFQACGQSLDLSRAPYVLYGVKYIDPVSLAHFSGPVKIEGLFAELDAPDEYYIDREQAVLYLFYNATSGVPPPGNRTLVVPFLQQLINVTGFYPTVEAAVGQWLTP